MLSNWDHDRNAERTLFQEFITLSSPFAAINPVHWVCQQCLARTDGWQYPTYILNIREAALTTAAVQHAYAVLQHIAQTLFRLGFRQEQGRSQ